MNRAERRRTDKRRSERPKSVTITMDELEKIRKFEAKKAKEFMMSKNTELANEILKMMLVIPTNVLIADFWPKSARKKIPEFVESCMSLYEAWEKGVVAMDEMQKLTEESAGIKLVKQGTPTDTALKERARKELR